MHRIVILGGGTGGTLVANRLRRALPRDTAAITVVDEDNLHVYQPGLLFLPFGIGSVEEITRERKRQLRSGIEFRQARIESVDLDRQTVHLGDAELLRYDVLVVATGARLQPEETSGLTGPGWQETVFTFYDVLGATRLGAALERFSGGELVVNLIDMPIKCPVAPLEFAFLADWFLTERGIQDRTKLTYVTPLDAAFTKPVASEHLAGLLADKHIVIETEFAAGEVDGERGILRSYDEREIPFDLLVTIPLHAGAAFVGRSEGLGDGFDFVATDPHTLQSTARANVFALGDATSLPTSKAGSVTHFEGEILTENILRYLDGEEPIGTYDGHANCFIETGFGKALLIDFNYDTEPLPGRFPTEHGPLSLLEESRLNHLGKLAFPWIYWHMLLPGRNLPGVSATMRPRANATPAAR